MSNEKQEIMVKYEIDGQEIKLTPSIVQEYIVGKDAKITMQEFKLFTELCKCRKLNVFIGVEPISRSDQSQAANLEEIIEVWANTGRIYSFTDMPYQTQIILGQLVSF